jgi:hypothetical protein
MSNGRFTKKAPVTPVDQAGAAMFFYLRNRHTECDTGTVGDSAESADSDSSFLVFVGCPSGETHTITLCIRVTFQQVCRCPQLFHSYWHVFKFMYVQLKFTQVFRCGFGCAAGIRTRSQHRLTRCTTRTASNIFFSLSANKNRELKSNNILLKFTSTYGE